MRTIPTFTIDEVGSLGFHTVHIRALDKTDSVQVAHRNQCYLFIIQRKGNFQLMLDFRKVMIKGPAMYFILPGQIHQYISAATDTWILAVDPASVQPYYKTILDRHFLMHDPVSTSPGLSDKLQRCIAILTNESAAKHASGCQHHITRGLIDTIVGMLVREYDLPQDAERPKEARSITITRQFKALLFQQYKEKKKPSDYADVLKISTPYLNQAVKSFSGFTVSYWIQKMVMTEAKRLLYYTDLSVKEIAYELGYDDQAYFSRLFTLTEKISPQGYRKRYR